jgi:hypothetical protein
VYSPSTMLASGSVASTAGTTISAWGTGADSSAAGVEPSSATAVLGSSSSCTVHNRLSTKYDYQATCTTRGRSSLTNSTGLLSRFGRQVYW